MKIYGSKQCSIKKVICGPDSVCRQLPFLLCHQNISHMQFNLPDQCYSCGNTIDRTLAGFNKNPCRKFAKGWQRFGCCQFN